MFEDAGAVREQFILSAAQCKRGQRRTVYVRQRRRKEFAEYGDTIKLADLQRPLFESQKGGVFSANNMCQLFLDIYRACGMKDASSHSRRRTQITRLANTGVQQRTPQHGHRRHHTRHEAVPEGVRSDKIAA